MGYEAFCRVGAAAEYHILKHFEEVGGDVGISHFRSRIHYGHREACRDGMIEEYGVHGLPQIVVAAESERQIAYAAACLGAGQIGVDPFYGADEVEGIAVVLWHTGGYGEHIGVEDYVARLEAGFFGKQPVCTAADGCLAPECCSLPLFVESHYDHSRTVAAYLAGMG